MGGREKERQMAAVWTEDCVAHMIDSHSKHYFVKKSYCKQHFFMNENYRSLLMKS